MGGMLMNGGAGGLSQGINQGAGLGMQYRQMQGDKEDRELQKELRDYQMKEQKLRLDQLKLEMTKDKNLEHAEQVFFEKFGSYPSGGSMPEQGSPPSGGQQQPQDIMQLMKLAMAAGKMPELAAGMQAGVIETPKSQREFGMKIAELQQKAVELGRDEQRFAWEGNKEKRAEAGEVREDIKLGLTKQQLSQKQKEFELQYSKAQMAAKEEEYRRGLGLKFLSEGTPEGIAAGQAVLGGDFAGGLKLRYPEVAGLTDNQIIAGVQRGDKVFAEILQIKRDMKEKTGIEVTYSKDGATTTRIGDLSNQPSIYPVKAFQEDAVAMDEIDLAVASLDDLGRIIKEDPMAVGSVGAGVQTIENLKAWAARMTGQEVKLSKTATAAQQIKTLELETTRKMVKSLGANPSNNDVKFIKEMIGGSGGIFSTSTAEQKLIALDALKAMMAREKAAVGGRQQNFEQSAPKKPARKTMLDKKMEDILGPPPSEVAPPDPAAIQKSIESMTPEQKAQRMQELLRKQGGG